MKLKPLLKRFTNFVLANHKNAGIVVVIAAFVPFFSWLASVVLCLVTLRKGLKQGLLLLPWALLPDIALYVREVPAGWLFLDVFGSYLLPLILAGVLRYSVSWQTVFASFTLISFFALGLMQYLYPSYPQILVSKAAMLFEKWQQEGSDFNLTTTELKEQLDFVAQYVFGFQLLVITLSSLINLVLARGLQSLVFCPGGLRKELLTIKLHWLWCLILAMDAIAWLMVDNSFFGNAFILLALPMVLSGLSIGHFLLYYYAKVHWLFVFYSVVIFFVPLSLVPVLILGISDSLLDFRKKKLTH